MTTRAHPSALRSAIGVFALLWLGVCATSCSSFTAFSDKPLSDPAAAVADARLAGLWVNTEDEAASYLHLVPRGGAMLDIITVDHKKGGAEVMLLQGFPTELAGERYLNLRFTSLPKGNFSEFATISPWFFVSYRFEEDGKALAFAIMEPEPAEEAIRAGRLAGRLKADEKRTGGAAAPEGATDDLGVPEILITDTPRRMAEFLAKTDRARLFTDWARVRRVTP